MRSSFSVASPYTDKTEATPGSKKKGSPDGCKLAVVSEGPCCDMPAAVNAAHLQTWIPRVSLCSMATSLAATCRAGTGSV